LGIRIFILRISVIAAGTQGDVQPMVALCAALNARGHRAELVSFDEFAGLAAEHGVVLRPLSSSFIAELKSEEGKKLFTTSGNLIKFVRSFIGTMRRGLRDMVNEGREYTASADIIVGSGAFDIPGQMFAEYWKKPYVHAFLQPLIGSCEYPSCLHSGWRAPLPDWLNRLEQQFALQAFWLASRFVVHSARRMLDLPPASWSMPYSVASRRGEEFLMGFSPTVVSRSRDWPANVHVTGYWFLDAPPSWKPPEALAQFLESGSPPVYFGFGSMGLRDPKATMQIVLATIAELGRRAIVSTGWGGLGVETPLPPNVHAIDGAPHDWLFPRVAVAVHHGGAGTTAAAVRAGIPSVVTPFLMDQFFWGKRLETLGLGPRALPHKKLTAQSLAKAVQLALEDNSKRRRAAEVGKTVRAEDGLTRAAEIIERAAAGTGSALQQ
jgi:UDP:flavonoid glycosyltransferase YjiC (YdhE family)